MKARRKLDGKIIEVTERQSWNKEVIYVCNGTFYRTSELDFNADESDTVIQGWVARDKSGDLFVYRTKPIRNIYTKRWESEHSDIDIYNNLLLLDLTWSDDPQEVEIIIKRKKK